ncbi:MAG: hypothetical protein MZU95_08290 [Desulfomicrobium escambiense]|nr:hypothetical protein [Desulfomicrobium escambiense]
MPRYILGNWWSKLLGLHRQASCSTSIDRLPSRRHPAFRLHRRHGLAHHRDRRRPGLLGRLDRLHREQALLPRLPGIHPTGCTRSGVQDLRQPASRQRREIATRTSIVEMAQWMGVDPAIEGGRCRSTPLRPSAMQGYFEILLHPYEEHGRRLLVGRLAAGVAAAKVAGLDPLWMAQPPALLRSRPRSHASVPSSSRAGAAAATSATRSASPATRSSRWERARAYQPYFTATAANVGYGWWSHDIGGHYGGKEDPRTLRPLGRSSASSARSCGCTRPPTSSPSANRGATRRASAPSSAPS